MSAAKCTGRRGPGSGFRVQGSGRSFKAWGIVAVACGSCLLAFAGAAWADERIAFTDQLAALAEKCDELGLKKQADATRSWIIPRHPGRQYLFLPAINDPTAPPAGAPENARQWHKRFLELRREQAEQLFAAAKAASAKREAARAYQLLHEVLREDPEHAEARRILGFQRRGADWSLAGAEPLAARAGALDHPRLGWRARSYWTLETSHYSIVTNHSQRELREAGVELENLHALWRQIFFTYWSAPEALAARFAGQDEPLARERPRMQVVLFKNRQEYAAHVAAAHPKAAATLGLYDDQQRIAYFFAGDKSVYPTWYHEATHQLFQESLPGVREQPGSERNFWALEGVALYMESLVQHSGYWSAGGCEADRLQLARYRVLSGDLDLPLARISALSREHIQYSDDIGRIYTQAAGLAHFLMDGESGAYRRAFGGFVGGIYRGQDTVDSLAKAVGRSPAELDKQYREYLNVTDDDLAGIPNVMQCRNLSLCRTGHQGRPENGPLRHRHGAGAVRGLKELEMARSVAHVGDGRWPKALCRE